MTGIQNQAEFQGLQTPPHYNAIKLDTIKTRMPIYSQQSKVVRFKPLEKDDSPSPTTYVKNDTRLSYRQTSPKVAFSLEKDKNYMDTHLRAKNFVPGPNSYDINRARKFITLGARSSYK